MAVVRQTTCFGISSGSRNIRVARGQKNALAKGSERQPKKRRALFAVNEKRFLFQATGTNAEEIEIESTTDEQEEDTD